MSEIPQVYVEDGPNGLDVIVTRGEVDVVTQDWGPFRDRIGGDYDLEDLMAMVHKLEGIADPNVRAYALDSLYDEIGWFLESLEGEIRMQEVARRTRIEQARKILREAGELDA